jgi:aerobic carbon-monoxide dehydrogenase small subunit
VTALERTVSFELDGEEVTVQVQPRLLLVDYLTFEAQVTGVHEGCCEGVCGACTIWIDGEPARSCLVFVAELEGRTVTTPVIALADPRFDGAHDALAGEHAIQCGYCMPGLLMSVLPDLVAESAEPEPISRLLSGNICRCAGYASIERALGTWQASLASKIPASGVGDGSR